MPQAIFWKDRNSVYLGCNKTFANAIGLRDPKDIVGKTDYDLPWLAKDTESYRRDDREVISSGVPKRKIIEELQQADGSRIWIQTSKQPLYDAQGYICGVLGSYIDISEQRKTEESLRKSEERLKLKLDSVLTIESDISEEELGNFIDAPALQSMMDDLYRITNMATAILDIKGSVIEATGWRKICTAFHRVHPETSKYCTESDLFLAKNMKQGEYVAYKCKNNMWDVVTPLYIANKHVGNIYTGQFFYDDETIDENTFITQAERYGFDKEQYLAALREVPRFSRQSVTTLMDFLTKLSTMISKLGYGNLKLVKANVELEAIQEELKKHREHLQELVDSRTKELAESNRLLTMAKEAAEKANRAKSLFLANMSHELRTPLNVVLGFAQLIQRDPNLDSQHRESLEIISRSGEHLLGLINDVLDISKIEADRIFLKPTTFDLHSTIQTIIEMMQIRAKEKGLSLNIDMASNMPRYIKGDEKKISQILINITGNAIKFTEKGEINVRIMVNEEQSNLLFEVQDTGSGIDPGDMPHLFEPFFQAGKAREGVGLGLFISQKLAKLMHGEIAVKSTRGKGSTFFLKIRYQTADPFTESPRSTIRKISGIKPEQPTRRILVVEDKVENRLLLVKVLRPIGFEVEEAGNGQEAVQMIQEGYRPEVILMDMLMPVMDGYEAIRQIRVLKESYNPIIIAVTASAFDEERQQILVSGANEFIAKPVELDDLFQKLQELLGPIFTFENEIDLTPRKLDIVALKDNAAKLPKDLLSDIHKSLTILDIEALLSNMSRVSEYSHELADAVIYLARRCEIKTLSDLFGLGE